MGPPPLEPLILKNQKIKFQKLIEGKIFRRVEISISINLKLLKPKLEEIYI